MIFEQVSGDTRIIDNEFDTDVFLREVFSFFRRAILPQQPPSFSISAVTVMEQSSQQMENQMSI